MIRLKDNFITFTNHVSPITPSVLSVVMSVVLYRIRIMTHPFFHVTLNNIITPNMLRMLPTTFHRQLTQACEEDRGPSDCG